MGRVIKSAYLIDEFDTFFQADHLLRAGDDQAAADAFGRIVDAAPEHVAA